MRDRSTTLLALLLVPVLLAATLVADDPRRSQLWWFDLLGVEQAWQTSTGNGVVVAVLDTGTQLDHPDLVGQFAERDGTVVATDLVDRDADPGDPNGHGTIVAGLVAAAAGNGEGVAGIAPDARLLPVRVLDRDGRGTAAVVDEGIRFAVDNGADVINLSLEVEDGPSGSIATAPVDAIRYAWDNGVVVVASTGNSGGGTTGYPEGTPVLLVGATDRQDELADFSDAGPADGVVAPGVEMVSTWCRNDGADGCDPAARYGLGSGTSFAAPVVAGVVALLLAAGLDHEQAVQRLRDTAVDLGEPGPDATFGAGRVDAAAALDPATLPSGDAGGDGDDTPEPSGDEAQEDVGGAQDGVVTPSDDEAGQDEAGQAPTAPGTDVGADPGADAGEEPVPDVVAAPGGADDEPLRTLLAAVTGFLVVVVGGRSLRELRAMRREG